MLTFPDSVFRAYDIRGVGQHEITPAFMRALGRALVAVMGAKRVVVGYDARPSSIEYAPYLMEGITEQGADVLHLGMVPTELVPITAGLQDISEAVIVTASHNPPEFVGSKLLTHGGRLAIGEANGRAKIRELMRIPEDIAPATPKGRIIEHDPWPDYLNHIFSIVRPQELPKPIKLLAEAGNGLGGVMVTKLLANLPVTVTPLLFEPDGTYPNHIPNPILPQSRELAAREAKQSPHDLTAMFDGDADRTAFLDATGDYVPSDYFDTLIMDRVIHPQHPESPVVIDYRKGWSTEDSGKTEGYEVFRTPAGYPNIKQAMHDHGAKFGYEASGHTMYADTFYSESSGLTLLYILKLLNETGQGLADLVAPYRERVKMIDEQNYGQPDFRRTFDLLKETYRDLPLREVDGLNIDAPDWHASIRASNTEPLIRLNLEARSEGLLEAKQQELHRLFLDSGAKLVDH